MDSSELRDIEKGFSRVKKTCKVIKALCLIAFVAFLVIWLVLSAVMILSAFSSEQSAAGFGLILYLLIFGVIIAALLWLALRFFSDIVKGESPFSVKQTKRLRIAALLLLGYAIIDAIMSANMEYYFDMMGYGVGFLNSKIEADSMMNINIGAIFASIALYCLSVAFEYGVLLQNLSDDTL